MSSKYFHTNALFVSNVADKFSFFLINFYGKVDICYFCNTFHQDFSEKFVICIYFRENCSENANNAKFFNLMKKSNYIYLAFYFTQLIFSQDFECPLSTEEISKESFS